MVSAARWFASPFKMDLFIALQVVFMSMTAKPAFYHFYYYLVIALKKYYVINQGDNSIVH